MHQYKHIIFDLGGIIELISPDNVVTNLKRYGMKDPKGFFNINNQKHLCDRFETGKCDSNEFIQHIQGNTSRDITKDEAIAAWNSNLLGVPTHNYEYLCKLKKLGIGMSILSNTNPIHYKAIKSNFHKTYQVEFTTLFDNIFLSYELGLRKPCAKLCSYIINKLNIPYGEILYIDDLTKNCEPFTTQGIAILNPKTNTPLHEILFF